MPRSCSPSGCGLSCRLLRARHRACCPLPAAATGRARPAAKRQGPAKANAPIPGYTRRVIQGFNVLIHREVFENDGPAVEAQADRGARAGAAHRSPRRCPTGRCTYCGGSSSGSSGTTRTIPTPAGRSPSTTASSATSALWRLAQTSTRGKANNVEIISMRALHEAPAGRQARALRDPARAGPRRPLPAFRPAEPASSSPPTPRRSTRPLRPGQGRLRPQIRPYARASEAEYFAELSCLPQQAALLPVRPRGPRGARPGRLPADGADLGPARKAEAVKKSDPRRSPRSASSSCPRPGSRARRARSRRPPSPCRN